MKYHEEIGIPVIQEGKSFEFPIHLRLPILPSNCQLVLDPEHGIVSLIIDHPAEGAKVLHQTFSPAALRLLVPILKAPDFCPYRYLLAAYDSNWRVLETLLKAPTVEAVPSFYNLSEIYQQRLDDAQQSNMEWDMLLRPTRRAIREIVSKMVIFEMKIINLSVHGYCIKQYKTNIRKRRL